MISTKKKHNYETPKLMVVEIRAERGYASSGLASQLNFWEWDELSIITEDNNHVEDYSTSNGWSEESYTFWN